MSGFYMYCLNAFIYIYQLRFLIIEICSFKVKQLRYSYVIFVKVIID